MAVHFEGAEPDWQRFGIRWKVVGALVGAIAIVAVALMIRDYMQPPSCEQVAEEWGSEAAVTLEFDMLLRKANVEIRDPENREATINVIRFVANYVGMSGAVPEWAEINRQAMGRCIDAEWER